MTRIAVIGALGDVGHGVVTAALARGWEVVAVGRDGARLAALAAELGSPLLSTCRGSVADEAGAAGLFADPAVAGADAVVTAVNGPRVRRALTDWTSTELLSMLADDLLPHFVAAKTAGAVLRPGAVYVAVGGGMADIVMRGHGHNSMVQAAQRMMLRAFAKELGSTGIHVRELIIASMVNGRSTAGHAPPDWLTAAEIGHRVCALIADPEGEPGPVVTMSVADRVRFGDSMPMIGGGDSES